MTLAEFQASLPEAEPPAGLSRALLGLWYEARGDWETAHRHAQEQDDPDGAWVHAYLHRQEGDLANARYWYRRAGRPPCSLPADQEWSTIATALLQQS